MQNKNIILAGLRHDNNLGDQAIFDSTNYLTKKILEKNNHKNTEIRIIDIGEIPQYSLFYRGIRKVYRFTIGKLNSVVIGKEKYDLTRCISKFKKMASKWEKSIDENTKAIIFTGGGIIKYKYQEFEYMVGALAEIANKHNIPVMISAAGVEGYDEDDLRCQYLKSVLNSPCFKIITTRDDINTLQNKYLVNNKSIISKAVADPACSIDKVYPNISKSVNTGRKKIGIGVIRTNIFNDNGINYSENSLTELYQGIIKLLVQKGYEVSLFCNGLQLDYDHAIRIKNNLEKENLRCELLSRPTNVTDLCTQICNFDGVIVGRLHASILAYAFDVPSVGIVWNDKQIFFGKYIGYPERFIEYNFFQPELIVKELEKSISEGYSNENKEEYVSTTQAMLKEFLDSVL